MATPVRQTIPGFRRWLKQTPIPARLRCGEQVVKMSATANRWREAEDTVAALNPASVHALDANGELLRVFNLREETRAESYETQKEDWPQSETAQLAQVITAACDRAASRHENAYKMAFDRLSDMYQAQSVRLEEALSRNAKLESALLRLQTMPVSVQEEPDTATTMLTTMLGAAATRMMSDGQQPSKPNGKGKQQ